MLRSGSLTMLEWLRQPSFAHHPSLSGLILSSLASPTSSPPTSPNALRPSGGSPSPLPRALDRRLTCECVTVALPGMASSRSDTRASSPPSALPSASAPPLPEVLSALAWRPPTRPRGRPALPIVDASPCPWDTSTAAAAAAAGHLCILEWIYSLPEAHRPPVDATACACAAGSGHIHLLSWLRARHAPWDSATCAMAAGGGHLDVIQWARRMGCPWGADTCAAAAGGGHLEVLQWCRRGGCAWDSWVVRRARDAGFEDVAQWALLHGCVDALAPAA